MPQRMTPEEQAARIAELEAQVAALKKIAVNAECYYNKHMWQEHDGYPKETTTEDYARRQLAEKHPEAF